MGDRKGIKRCLDKLDRALRNVVLNIDNGALGSAVWWVGEAEKEAAAIREWNEGRPGDERRSED